MEEQKRGCDNGKTSNNAKQPIFLKSQVEKYRNPALKERLKTLILAKGMSQADFYHSLGLGKDYWYMISWGRTECPADLKVKIAVALGVDSSVIWQEKKE